MSAYLQMLSAETMKLVKGDSRQRENGKLTEWSSIFKLAAYTTWVPLSSRAARQTGTCNHIPSSQRLISRAWSQGTLSLGYMRTRQRSERQDSILTF